MIYRLALVLATLIWGIAFVAQVLGMNYVGPFTFNGVRFLLGSLSLIPVICILKEKKPFHSRIPFWAAVLAVGLPLFYASAAQQIALQYVSVAKTSFLGSTYILMVPFAGLMIGFPLRLTHILGAMIAIIGVYLLTVSTGFTIDPWDLLVLSCAVGFTLQIVALTIMTRYYPPVMLSCGSFLVTGILNMFCAFLFETPDLSAIYQARYSILYTAVLSTGVAYTLQAVGQKHLPPTEASMILSLEMVFGSLSGILFLGESLTLSQTAGAVAMVIGVLLSQLPGKVIIPPVHKSKKGVLL